MVTKPTSELTAKFAALLDAEKHRLDRTLGEDLRELRAKYGSGSRTVQLMQGRFEADIEERSSTLLAKLSQLLANTPARQIRDNKPDLDRLAQVWLQSHIDDCQSSLNEYAARIGSVSQEPYDLGRDRFLSALVVELDLVNSTAPPAAASTEVFVDPVRIDELSSVPADKFDVSRLVRLCEELNSTLSDSRTS
jgi:hypothetical protein